MFKRYIICFFFLYFLIGCKKQNGSLEVDFIKNKTWKIINFEPSTVTLSFHDETYEFKNSDGSIREYGNYSYANSSITFERTSQMLNIPLTRNKYTLTVDLKYMMMILNGKIISTYASGYADISWVLIKN